MYYYSQVAFIPQKNKDTYQTRTDIESNELINNGVSRPNKYSEKCMSRG
jgi:hypothetical protein